MMQLPVLLGPPSICHGRVIIRQELLVKPTRQDSKNLHWVIRIVVIDRLRCHSSHHSASRSAYRAGWVAARYRYRQVDPLPTSRPILQRLGFEPVATATPYVWTPPGR